MVANLILQPNLKSISSADIVKMKIHTLLSSQLRSPRNFLEIHKPTLRKKPKSSDTNFLQSLESVVRPKRYSNKKGRVHMLVDPRLQL